jgi:hypothetical protein
VNTAEKTRELLLEAHPAPRSGTFRDWEEVLRRTRPSRRRRGWVVRRAALLAAAVAAVAAVVLATPFGDEENVDVLGRALAAVGEGPVLHVVLEEEWGGVLVDLETGERSRLRGERELWYDPERGVRDVSRLGGVVERDLARPAGELAEHETKILAFLTGYREALESGRARVVGEGVVHGEPVYWIRIHDELLPDVADNRLHEWARDVAVSKETFAPVATRETRDGEPGPQAGARIVRMEALPAGAVDFTPRRTPDEHLVMSVGAGAEIDVAEARRLLGRGPLTLGEEFRGIPLGRIARLELGARREGEEWDRIVGAEVFYGQLDEQGRPRFSRRPSGAPGVSPPPEGAEYVLIEQVPRPHPAFRIGVQNYMPPEGKALLIGPRVALRRDGLLVAVSASSPELALAAARALASAALR